MSIKQEDTMRGWLLIIALVLGLSTAGPAFAQERNGAQTLSRLLHNHRNAVPGAAPVVLIIIKFQKLPCRMEHHVKRFGSRLVKHSGSS